MDIRELRIGNHVLYNGEQRTVSSIDLSDGFAPFVAFEGRGKFHHCKDIDPIPITEELLKELGFEDKIVAGTWKMMIKSFGEYELVVSIQGGECGLNVRPLDESKGDMFGSCFSMRDIQYLHTLETFVYLTTKRELI